MFPQWATLNFSMLINMAGNGPATPLASNATYVGPAEYDMNAMVAAFDQAIAKKPKGIAVFAVEPILEPSINKAVEAGIPVVTILGDLPEYKAVGICWLGPI